MVAPKLNQSPITDKKDNEQNNQIYDVDKQGQNDESVKLDEANNFDNSEYNIQQIIQNEDQEN